MLFTGNDGHKSDFSLSWLADVLFKKKQRNVVLWDQNTIQSNINNVKVPLNDYLKPDGIKHLLKSILSYGFGIVTGVRYFTKTTINKEYLKPFLSRWNAH